MNDKIRALLISSPVRLEADNGVNFLAFEHLERSRFELYAASQIPAPGEPSHAFEVLAAMPGVTTRPTDFGPELFHSTVREKLRGVVRAPLSAASLAGLALYIRRHRIQILHSTDRPRDAMTCVLLARLTGAKSVIHVHVKYGDWMKRGVKLAMHRADALIAVSEFVARSLAGGGYDARRIHPVPNAIDLRRWDPALDPGIGRRSLGVGDRPLIVSVARLFSWKGHPQLIRAVALIREQVPDVRVAIVGPDYPPGSGATRTLQALAAELGVQDQIIFTGSRSDVPELLAAADVFALPSFEEPFGLVFAEAMAMKRPVVALANGGTPEVVDHGGSGLLSPPEDIPALAENLLTLLKNRSLREKMGEHGRARVEARFTPDRLASGVAAVYERLLDGAAIPEN